MRQAVATQLHTTLWQQDGWAKAVAHTACVHYDCCTGQHKVVNKGARRWYGVVIWLTSDATSMCVKADQEHLSLMGEHCLSLSTLPPFYHGKGSHALVTQCVHVRAYKNPRRGFSRRDGVVLVCPDQHVAPATKIDQCIQKARTKNAHAKYFVLDHPFSRPDKICTHAQTCQRNAHMCSEL